MLCTRSLRPENRVNRLQAHVPFVKSQEDVSLTLKKYRQVERHGDQVCLQGLKSLLKEAGG